MTFIASSALLLPPARALPAELADEVRWQAVREWPGESPTEMAVLAGRAALASSGRTERDIGWLLHTGTGLQGPHGWPLHHRVQFGILGPHGNSLELKQYCAGGLTAWVVAGGLLNADGVMCTGSDNWSWGDRFAAAHSVAGEPFSDAAHAVVLTADAGFAAVIGHGTASCPGQSDAWKTRENYWEPADLGDYCVAYRRAIDTTTQEDREATLQMMLDAVDAALRCAGVSAPDITHFVPHASGSGEPYRGLASVLGLPWSETLQRHQRENGYLGVSTQIAGLTYLAEAGLPEHSLVLLLAVEYQLSATAVVLRLQSQPSVRIEGQLRIMA